MTKPNLPNRRACRHHPASNHSQNHHLLHPLLLRRRARCQTDGDRRDVPRIFSEATKTKAWLAKADEIIWGQTGRSPYQSDANMHAVCATSQLRCNLSLSRAKNRKRKSELPRVFVLPGYRAKNAREPGAPSQTHSVQPGRWRYASWFGKRTADSSLRFGMTILECLVDWNGQHVESSSRLPKALRVAEASGRARTWVPGLASSVREGKGFLAALGMTIPRVSRS